MKSVIQKNHWDCESDYYCGLFCRYKHDI